MKTRLLELHAEEEELNESQSMATCILIGLSFHFSFRLQQSDFQKVISDGVTSGVRRNGNVLVPLTLIPSRL